MIIKTLLSKTDGGVLFFADQLIVVKCSSAHKYPTRTETEL